MRRAAGALRLLPRAVHLSAQDTVAASCIAPRQWSHHQAGFSGRCPLRSPPFDSQTCAPHRGFAAEATAQETEPPQPQAAERALRNFPSLGRAALPGRGRGNVNAAMEEAPEQYTVLPGAITERYPKVRVHTFKRRSSAPLCSSASVPTREGPSRHQSWRARDVAKAAFSSA